MSGLLLGDDGGTCLGTDSILFLCIDHLNSFTLQGIWPWPRIERVDEQYLKKKP